MATVFITNHSGNNYEKAKKYGDLKNVTHGRQNVFKMQALLSDVVKVIRKSDSDDYLLISGSAVVSSLCTMTWFYMHHRCKVLIFDAGDNDYVLKELTQSTINAILAGNDLNNVQL